MTLNNLGRRQLHSQGLVGGVAEPERAVAQLGQGEGLVAVQRALAAVLQPHQQAVGGRLQQLQQQVLRRAVPVLRPQ